MGKRDSAHQPTQQSGFLVSAQQLRQFPLLPVERDLIDLLGISEGEYRKFQAEVNQKGRLRPAEYEHIPDIQNGPALVPILVNLAIGVALTGISMLLAPKQNRPEDENKEVTQRKIADELGRNRFNENTGFGSVQQIAALGDRVPILFGRYRESSPPTGGISTAPTLLWSRMLSYGRHQTFRGIYMLGQQLYDDLGGGRPSISGVLIGNNGLDNLSERKYALYYSSGRDDGNNQDRIIDADLIAGSRGEASAGDRFTSQDPFLVPTEDGVQPGFSMATNPSNQTAFGCHSPIRNGSSIRVNWSRIPFWPDDLEDDDRVKDDRAKIAGKRADGRETGMKGTGRGYSPKMGVVQFNAVDVERMTEFDAVIGNTILFAIKSDSYRDRAKDLGFRESTGVTGDDIQSTTNSMRQAADDALVEGEIFQIGEGLWQVHQRQGTYVSDDRNNGQDAYIVLKLIEILSDSSSTKVGVCGWETVRKWVTDEGGDETGTEKDFNRGWVGQLWYPLLQSDIAVVRSERQMATTDIGIASTVYTQLNGLANFPALPTPKELVGFDNDRVQVAAGRQSLYTDRASFFTVHIRPSGLDNQGKTFSWVPTRKKFVVKGNQPVEQYNFIRFLCNQSPAGKTNQGEFEFRFVGIAVATLARNTEETEMLHVLDAKSTEFHSFSDCEAHGYRFQATYRGRRQPFGDFWPLNEFINRGKKGEFGYRTLVVPGSQLTLAELYPRWIPNGRLAAYWYEVLGDPERNKGKTKTYRGKAYARFESGAPDLSSDYVEFEVRATSIRVNWHEEAFNKDWVWSDYSWTVLKSTGDWKLNQRAFTRVEVDYNSDNPYTQSWPPPLDFVEDCPDEPEYEGNEPIDCEIGGDWNVGMELQVNEVRYEGELIEGEAGRIFEKYSGFITLWVEVYSGPYF